MKIDLVGREIQGKCSYDIQSFVDCVRFLIDEVEAWIEFCVLPIGVW
jgi:hypothetical protein